MAPQDRIPQDRAAVPDDEINLFDYLRVIYRYRWSILLISFLAAAAVGVLTYRQPPRYSATVSIVPPRDSSGGGGLGSGLLGGAQGALLRKVMDSGTVADMYVGILESRTVANAIVDRFDLTDMYDVNGVRHLAERQLRGSTTIKRGDEGIVSISVVDGDPNLAAAIANAYVEELDGQNKRLSAGQATSKRVFLENRLEEIEQKLRNIENMPAHEAQVQEMLYELLGRELELAKIEEARSMPTIQVLDRAVAPEIRMARGTVRKAMLAGMAALAFMIFVAFTREYIATCRAREAAFDLAEREADALEAEGVEVDRSQDGSFVLPSERPKRTPPNRTGNGRTQNAPPVHPSKVTRGKAAPAESVEQR